MADAEKDLKIVISSDSSQAQSDIQGLGAGTVAFGVAAGEALEKVSEKVLQMAQDFITAGLEAGQQLQFMRTNMDALVGSSTKVEAILGSLQDLVKKGIFSDEQVASYTQKLITMGYSQDKINGLIHDMANATVGSSGSLEDASGKMMTLVTQLGYVNDKGEINIGMFGRMAKQLGIPIFQVLAEQLGVSADELSLHASKYHVTADMITQAFHTMSSGSGEFAGAVDRDSKTQEGRLAALKNSWSDLQHEILGVSDTGEVVKGSFFDVLTTAIQNLTEFLTSHKDIVIAGLAAIAVAVLGLAVAFAALAISIAPITITIVLIGLLVAAVVFAVVMIVQHWDTIRTKTLEVWGAIGNFLNQTWTAIKTKFEQVWGGIITFFQSIPGFFGSIWSSIEKWFQSGIDLISNKVKQFFSIDFIYWIGFTYGYITTAIPLIIGKIQEWFSKIPGIVLAALIATYNWIVQKHNEEQVWIDNKMKEIIMGIYTWWNSLPGLIWGILVNVYNFIVQKFTEAWAWISAEVPTWPLKIWNFLKSIPGDIGGILEDLKNAFTKKLGESWTMILDWKNKVVDAFNKVKDAIEGAISSLEKGIAKGVASATGQFSGKAMGGFASGMTLVGEQGPELVDLPSGSYVHTNTETKNMMGGTTVNIYNPSVRQDSDITDIVNQIKRVLGRDNELAKLGAI